MQKNSFYTLFMGSLCVCFGVSVHCGEMGNAVMSSAEGGSSNVNQIMSAVRSVQMRDSVPQLSAGRIIGYYAPIYDEDDRLTSYQGVNLQGRPTNLFYAKQEVHAKLLPQLMISNTMTQELRKKLGLKDGEYYNDIGSACLAFRGMHEELFQQHAPLVANIFMSFRVTEDIVDNNKVLLMAPPLTDTEKNQTAEDVHKKETADFAKWFEGYKQGVDQILTDLCTVLSPELRKHQSLEAERANALFLAKGLDAILKRNVRYKIKMAQEQAQKSPATPDAGNGTK